MKCACGYEYETKESGDYSEVVIKGDEDFIKSTLNVTYSTDVNYEIWENRTVYICPKCKTLKLGEKYQ